MSQTNKGFSYNRVARKANKPTLTIQESIDYLTNASMSNKSIVELEKIIFEKDDDYNLSVVNYTATVLEKNDYNADAAYHEIEEKAKNAIVHLLISDDDFIPPNPVINHDDIAVNSKFNEIDYDLELDELLQNDRKAPIDNNEDRDLRD